MKSTDGSSKLRIKRFLGLMMLSFIMLVSCYVYHNYYTYQSIKVVVKDTPSVEYGSANYNVKEFIEEVEGNIISVIQDIDVNKIGEQEVILEVQKDNVVKEVPIVITVVDSVAPVIKVKEEKVTITQGDNYNPEENIESVLDEIDGDINISSEEIKEDSVNYYSINYNEDINSVGNHEITVNAVDKSGNSSTFTFTLEVVQPTPQYIYGINYNVPANPVGNDVVSIAYSLLGMPYISGSNGPYGFDCSGFVQYVYSCVGKYVSRSSYTQIYDGIGVGYADAQPGDILSWGYGYGNVTHSALYVGNGMMIHAANSGTGVVLDNVDYWINGSGTSLLSVRRIQ